MRSITRRFGATVALDGVDLEVKAGEIHAILGENGAGKSTLMHILAGMTSPSSGEIRIDGRPVRLNTPREARQAGIAMVHQHFTLVPAFSVEENLALDSFDTPDSDHSTGAPSRGDHSSQKHSLKKSSLKKSSLKKSSLKKGSLKKGSLKQNSLLYRAHDAASSALSRARSLGWDLPAKTRVADLPVGTQQRVEIIKALATQARILIFDEPTAVLAGAEVEELFTVLRRLRDEGHAVLLIAHKLREILAVADRVTVLRRGKHVITREVAECTAEQLALWMIAGNEQTGQVATLLKEEEERPESQLIPSQVGPVALKISGLNVRGDQGHLVLRDLVLTLHEGEIFGIGGVDGNGQTELAEILVGLRMPESGTLYWKETPFRPGIAPRTGYIPQDRRRVGLATGLPVEENLLFAAVDDRQYRFGPFLRRRKLHALAETLRRDYDIRVGDLRQPAATLSGGNQQKIVVARALHARPECIVAVNPTRGLDLGATRFVHSQLRAARDRGAVVVLISTDLDEVAALSDRQAILSGGTLSEFTAGDADVAQLGMLLGGLRSE